MQKIVTKRIPFYTSILTYYIINIFSVGTIYKRVEFLIKVSIKINTENNRLYKKNKL